MKSDKKKTRFIYVAEKKIEQRKVEEAYHLIKPYMPEEIETWTATEQGIFYWISGQWKTYQKQAEEALSYYDKSISLFTTSFDHTRLIRTIISKSKVISLSGQEEKALHLLMEAYETAIYEQIDSYTLITLLFQLGVQHGKLGEVYSAIYFFPKH